MLRYGHCYHKSFLGQFCIDKCCDKFCASSGIFIKPKYDQEHKEETEQLKFHTRIMWMAATFEGFQILLK